MNFPFVLFKTPGTFLAASVRLFLTNEFLITPTQPFRQKIHFSLFANVLYDTVY